jgi:hypothetical protein
MHVAHGKALASRTLLCPSIVSWFFKWGATYYYADDKIRHWLSCFAAQKLLCSGGYEMDSEAKLCAVLSQRLALDINTTAFVSKPLLGAFEAILEQIAMHMPVCVDPQDGIQTIRGIAASEPILSESASFIMRAQDDFDLANALEKVLRIFLINLKGRGESLVAAFFPWARDMVMVKWLRLHIQSSAVISWSRTILLSLL